MSNQSLKYIPHFNSGGLSYYIFVLNFAPHLANLGQAKLGPVHMHRYLSMIPNKTSYILWIWSFMCITYFMLCLSTTNILVERANKDVCTLFPPKKQRKDPHFDKCWLFAHPISQHVYRGFVFGGSSCRSGREVVSQYHYGSRICGGCGGGRAGFVGYNTGNAILTHQNITGMVSLPITIPVLLSGHLSVRKLKK